MRLYVTNLPADATPSELIALFAPHGAVTDAATWDMTSRERPTDRVGFVTLPDEPATTAAAALGGADYRGRVLGVELIRPWFCPA